MHAHLQRSSYPRLELSLIIALSGMAAFLVSYALLGGGMTSMALRYGVAGVSGYVAFLCLIALWIAWKRHFQGDLDVLDAIDLLDPADLARVSGGTGDSLFAGGRSGGGGNSASWGPGSGRGEGGGGLAFDLDDLWWLLLIAAAAFSGLVVIGYVVYLAPVLLAEVLVDAVIVATISSRFAATEKRDWTATLMRHTWLPALAVIALLVIGGWALQQIAPDARSIGQAIGTLKSEG